MIRKRKLRHVKLSDTNEHSEPKVDLVKIVRPSKIVNLVSSHWATDFYKRPIKL